MEESKAHLKSKKRSLELNIRDSPYYRMRALLRDLRPNFIELMKTPESDFLNCKAADEIRDGMKVLMELYKEMMAQTGKLQKCNNDVEHQEDVKAGVSSPLHTVDDRPKGTYIVGGSAVDWNFLAFPGSQTGYYGVTKEAFRARNPKHA